MIQIDYVSIFFEDTTLKENGINVKLSTDLTKVETEVGINYIYTKEEQSRIGDYYYVLDQPVPLSLCTETSKKILEKFGYLK